MLLGTYIPLFFPQMKSAYCQYVPVLCICFADVGGYADLSSGGAQRSVFFL